MENPFIETSKSLFQTQAFINLGKEQLASANDTTKRLVSIISLPFRLNSPSFISNLFRT
jgi:hypothetical protein